MTALPTDKLNDCVILAGRHHGLSEGVRGLLETTFSTVVMVADEVSLFESATRLSATLAIVDLSLAAGDGVGLVSRLRGRCPHLKLIVISVHDEGSVSQSVLSAGADGFVIRHAIATDLLPAVNCVLAGERYLSPAVRTRNELA